jgi:hypothetical protein
MLTSVRVEWVRGHEAGFRIGVMARLRVEPGCGHEVMVSGLYNSGTAMYIEEKYKCNM